MTRRWLLTGVAALALLLLAGKIFSGWYVEYQWFAANGAARLWATRAIDLLLLRGAAFVLGSLFAFANLMAVRHSVRSLRLPRRIGNIDFSEEVPSRILNGTALVMALALGAVLAVPHDDWISVELIRSGQLFGETDPYFRLDLGTWLYQLPLESAAHIWAMVVLVGMTLLVTLLYALTPSLRWERGTLYVSGYVRRHLFLLAAVLLLLLAWSYRLDAFGLLHQGTGPLGALSAIDHRVGIPSNLILALIAVAAAMLVAWAGWNGQVRVAFFTLTIMLLAALTARQVVPAVAGRFVTATDPEAQEQSYREIRSAYTRRAYAVDEVGRPAAPEAPGVADALRGASLWDGEALRRVLGGARQGARPNGALSWESQDGRLIAYVLQRPLATGDAGTQVAWGLERVAADVTDDRGAPVERDHPDLSARQAVLGVVFHDSAPAWKAMADTGATTAGIALESLVDRVAHAWHLQNLSLLRRRPLDAVRRIVLRPDVRERVASLYPFFTQESRVTPLVSGDTVHWIVPLYETSDWYPLSTPLRIEARSIRYQRLAAIAIVNATSGRVSAVPSARPGPMAATWIARFPELFTDATAVDPVLAEKLLPPSDGAWLVAQALALAGLRGEYEARGRLPLQAVDSIFTRATTPPYIDQARGVLSLAIPVLEPTDEVRGLLVATGGPDPRVEWYRWDDGQRPKWTQIIAGLQAAVDSLPAAREARPLGGAVRMIPTRSGPVVIQAHYSVRPDGDLQVIAAAIRHADTVSTGRSLIDAAGMPDPVETVAPLTAEEFRRRVGVLYEAMREAMRRGDWVGIGATWDALGRLLRAARQP